MKRAHILNFCFWVCKLLALASMWAPWMKILYHPINAPEKIYDGFLNMAGEDVECNCFQLTMEGVSHSVESSLSFWLKFGGLVWLFQVGMSIASSGVYLIRGRSGAPLTAFMLACELIVFFAVLTVFSGNCMCGLGTYFVAIPVKVEVNWFWAVMAVTGVLFGVISIVGRLRGEKGT